MQNPKNKPAIRFKGFTDAWEQRQFKTFAGRSAVWDLSSKECPCIEYQNIEAGTGNLKKDFSSNNAIKLGQKFSKGDIVFGKLRPYLKNWFYAEFSGIAVGDFWIFSPKEVDSYFLYALIQGKDFLLATNQSVGSKMPRADWKLIASRPFRLPTNRAQQRRIGSLFIQLEHLITLHQRKHNTYSEEESRSKLPKNNYHSKTKQLEPSSQTWEQRKLKECATIERGGSPRPIEAFITKERNGLNWVKIGDAPEQGRYITKTAEKIKKSGLSKTREVFPGDLVLSNSMSFGRPYIMGICGCIHDGWLLIRLPKEFNRKFFCHFLGSELMLSQYKSLAAGSTVNNLNKELVGGAVVSTPEREEQSQLGNFFERLDFLIALHQRES